MLKIYFFMFINDYLQLYDKQFLNKLIKKRFID